MAAIVNYRLWSLCSGKLMQARIWIGILIGSTIGGFIPDLWGAGLFSYSSILLSGVGAFVGLWIGYKLA
jgi:predicted MFS family arabinose efflux permease